VEGSWFTHSKGGVSRKFYDLRKINLNFRQNVYVYFRYILRKTVNKLWYSGYFWNAFTQSKGNRLLPERNLYLFITIDRIIIPSFYSLACGKVNKRSSWWFVGHSLIHWLHWILFGSAYCRRIDIWSLY